MSVYYASSCTQILVGDARQILAGLATASVECIVTSPPYWGLRDYDHPDQYGGEDTPEDYVRNLCDTFAEAHRVLADEGTLWLNLGDRYAANSDGFQRGQGFHDRQPHVRPGASLAPKNLLGLPWRVALALQEQGWILRNAIIWHKPNAMPHSVADRCSNRYEHLFLFAKQRRYHFDLDAVREPCSDDRSDRSSANGGSGSHTVAPRVRERTQPEAAPNHPHSSGTGTGKYTDAADAFRGTPHGANMRPGTRHEAAHPRGRNPGDVWSISTRPFRQAHFAVFPIDLPLRAIAAGCPQGGMVLDPFAGAGTTLLAARQLGRRAVGIDLNPDYAQMALARLRRARVEGRSL